jgi:acyl carrier protein
MKNKEEIFSELSVLLVEMFELDPSDITTDANLYEDLDLDSIDAVDLVVKLKEMTGAKITPEDFKNVRTIDDVVCAVEELISDS